MIKKEVVNLWIILLVSFCYYSRYCFICIISIPFKTCFTWVNKSGHFSKSLHCFITWIKWRFDSSEYSLNSVIQRFLYDFLIFDTGAGISSNVTYFCCAAHEIILIVTAEPTSMTDAYALMKAESGAIAMLHSSATEWRHRFQLDLALEKGSIFLSGILSGSKSYGAETLTVAWSDENGDGDPRQQSTQYTHDPSWADEIAEFATAIHDNTDNEGGRR